MYLTSFTFGGRLTCCDLNLNSPQMFSSTCGGGAEEEVEEVEVEKPGARSSHAKEMARRRSASDIGPGASAARSHGSETLACLRVAPAACFASIDIICILV